MNYPPGVNPPTEKFGWPTIPMNISLMLLIVQHQREAGMKYGFGSKLQHTNDSFQSGRVDCSGEVEYLTWRCSGVDLPEGSFVEHTWFANNGFKVSDYEAGFNKDGILRIAFLAPGDSLDNIGHVLFILNGICIESHGSTGPDNSREWGSRTWMKAMHVFVMDVPVK